MINRLEDAAVPALVDASGLFETCRVRAGKILHLKEHLIRLRASLKTAGMGLEWDETETRRRLRESAWGISRGYVRIAIRRRGNPKILIHRHLGEAYSKQWLKHGIAIRTVPTLWPLGESSWAQIKGSERLNGILARVEGGDCPEVLRIGAHGYLTEGTVSNFFLVKDGVLKTPPGWLGVLEGVTKDRVIQRARQLGLPVETIPLTRHDLFNADEAFLTNVLMGILSIRQVDGRRIGDKIPGPITRRLMRVARRERV